MRKSKIWKFSWLITNNHLQESQSNQESHKKSNDNQKSNNTMFTNTVSKNDPESNNTESNLKNEVFQTIYIK